MATAAMTSLRDQFFEDLALASKSVLLLDYDGTLAPFRVDRFGSVPYEGATELVRSIISTNRTRVAFVTGRPAMELAALLPISPTPEVWGSHGLEQMANGKYQMTKISPKSQELLSAVHSGLIKEGLRPLLEVKAGAIAVHWRNLCPSLLDDIRERVARVWLGVQPQDQLALGEFDGGIEVRLRTPNKGDVVRQVLQEVGDGMPVAYLGDDVTDEDAFRALKNEGLSVLVRDEYRKTHADIWVRPPEGVLRLLIDWLAACGGMA